MKTNRQAHTISPARLLLPTVLALGALLGSAPSGRAAAFVPGEILFCVPDVPSIQRYGANGTLRQTYFGTGSNYWTGDALTPDGNLVTAYDDGPSGKGIDIFNPGGTQITTFAVTGNSSPSDLSVFSNGTLALNDFSNNTVQFWSQTGTLLNTVTLPSVSNPTGSTVGSDGILYVACSGSKKLAQVNSNGSFLGLISLSFSPGDLVMNSLDGSLWVIDKSNQRVQHLKTDGTVLGSIASAGFNTYAGIGLAPDNLSIYVVTAGGNASFAHFDLSGNRLGGFNVTSPNSAGVITVVPAAAPEPGSATLILGGLGLLAVRRRASA